MRLNLNPVLQLIFLSISLVVLVLTIITFFWKISVHSAGAGGITGILMALSFIFPGQDLYIPLSLVILLSGVILASRLKLNVHTPRQIYFGFLTGFVISFSLLILKS